VVLLEVVSSMTAPTCGSHLNAGDILGDGAGVTGEPAGAGGDIAPTGVFDIGADDVLRDS